MVHYLNQFFGGIGGEDRAGTPLQVHDGVVGSGRALEQLLDDGARIMRTLVCGDNAFHADAAVNLEAALGAIADAEPDLVLAGPAFNAGRYGLACAAVAAGARERLWIPAVIGLFPDAPAVDVYRSRVVMVATADSAAGMRPALESMARVGLRLARARDLLPAADDGRIPMGYRGAWVNRTPVAARALDMLMAKLGGEPYTSEVRLSPQAETVPPAPAVADLSTATVAILTEGGARAGGQPGPHRILRRHPLGPVPARHARGQPAVRVPVHPCGLRHALGWMPTPTGWCRSTPCAPWPRKAPSAGSTSTST